MLIENKNLLVTVPDGWIKKESPSDDYFESSDETKGIYLNSYHRNDWGDDLQIVKEVISIEKNKLKEKDGYRFKIMCEENGTIGEYKYGLLDQYDKKRKYRIATYLLVINKNILRLAFHDYLCDDYKSSEKEYQNVIKSLYINPDYSWKYGCNWNSPAIKKAQIIKEEGEFVDVDLFIKEYELGNNEEINLLVESLIEDKVVGFKLFFDGNWEKKPIENSNDFYYWGSAKIVGNEIAAENFVSQLEKIYDLKKGSFTAMELNAVVVGLVNDPRRMIQELSSMKFFINSDNEALYAEVYINVDLGNRVLEFHEKDPEYRKNIMKALSGQT